MKEILRENYVFDANFVEIQYRLVNILIEDQVTESAVDQTTNENIHKLLDIELARARGAVGITITRIIHAALGRVKGDSLILLVLLFQSSFFINLKNSSRRTHLVSSHQ